MIRADRPCAKAGVSQEDTSRDIPYSTQLGGCEEGSPSFYEPFKIRILKIKKNWAASSLTSKLHVTLLSQKCFGQVAKMLRGD